MVKNRGGEADFFLAMLKGGTSFEIVLTQEPEVLAVLMGGGCNKFPPFRRGGGAKSFTLSLRGGGGGQKFWTSEIPIF